MDNLFEIILPLIFFAVYFASQFFGKKSEEDAPGESTPDDLKKIREELRRKIQERKKESQPAQQQQREREQPSREGARGGAVLRESQPRRSMVDQRADSTQALEAAARATAAQRKSSIERDLEEQMEEVRLSQEKADAARRQAREQVAAVARAAAKAKAFGAPTSYRQFLREALDDPQSLQKSFVLHEVFGTPVGMRREGQMRPSWDL